MTQSIDDTLLEIDTRDLSRYARCGASLGREREMRVFIRECGFVEPDAHRADDGQRGVLAAVPLKPKISEVASVEDAADSADVVLTYGAARQLAILAKLRNVTIHTFVKEREAAHGVTKASVDLTGRAILADLEFPYGVRQRLRGRAEIRVVARSADGTTAVLHIDSGLRDGADLHDAVTGELNREYVANAAMERIADDTVEVVRVVYLGRGALNSNVTDFHDFDVKALEEAIVETEDIVSRGNRNAASGKFVTAEKVGVHCQQCVGRGCCEKLKMEARKFVEKNADSISNSIEKWVNAAGKQVETGTYLSTKEVLGEGVLVLEKYRALINRVLSRGDFLTKLQKQAVEKFGSKNFKIRLGNSVFGLADVSERRLRDGVERVVGKMNDLDWILESRELNAAPVRDYIARQTSLAENEVIPWLKKRIAEMSLSRKSPLEHKRDNPKVRVSL